tara:strand:- start:4011 stop:4196 length:186 start_codon:yes stop_codon:yes gene_type:complete
VGIIWLTPKGDAGADGAVKPDQLGSVIVARACHDHAHYFHGRLTAESESQHAVVRIYFHQD